MREIFIAIIFLFIFISGAFEWALVFSVGQSKDKEAEDNEQAKNIA